MERDADNVTNRFSLLGLAMMIIGVAGLALNGSLLSLHYFPLLLQSLAIGLMIWARVVFGHRSFNASAEPTSGDLIRTGPYRYIRHPIYTAACSIVVVGVTAYLSIVNIGLAMLVLAGAVVRMRCEEKLLLVEYPEYSEYKLATKRMVPGVY